MKSSDLRAATVVAAVYGYFLIFAQFSFVELLRAGGASLAGEKTALGAMAVAGIAGGILAAWRGVSPAIVRISLGVAASCAALAPFCQALPGALGVAVATGCALGVATVSLAALLPAWCGVVWVGVGTGLGYACCNLPVIFTASPAVQSWVGAGLAVVGLCAVPGSTEWRANKHHSIFPAWAALALFTALVWLDSAAFFIIQHSEDLKSGTWGDRHLWRNAALHLSVAIAAGFGLARGGARVLPALAWVLLAVAALAVNSESTRVLAGWVYPAGVSLYSAALVAWPGWFSGASGRHPAAWRAAGLFGLAGWFGSANGIGMAQTLQRVPPVFVAVSGTLALAVMASTGMKHWRSAIAVWLVAWVSLLVPADPTDDHGDLSIERGRLVYLSEGCIHCHSQYVRPGSIDEEIWGPVREVTEVLGGKPVLIGNRRQGPDLSNVGARRSEAWLKIQLTKPQAIVPGSAMPCYAHLFESDRGNDLVRYLKQSGVQGTGSVIQRAARWKPDARPVDGEGRVLFGRHCAACHGQKGLGNGPISLELARKPANLVSGPFVWTPPGEALDLRVARVIKFGLPGTDMPGHEVLTDSEVVALAREVVNLRAD